MHRNVVLSSLVDLDGPARGSFRLKTVSHIENYRRSGLLKSQERCGDVSITSSWLCALFDPLFTLHSYKELSSLLVENPRDRTV
jgi:hypothetical protein